MKLSPSEILKNLLPYLIVLVLFWTLSGILLLSKGYEGSFIFLNSCLHNSITDFLGIHLTHLADGIILPFLLLIIAWKKDKALPIAGFIMIIGTGIFVQILKNVLFEGWGRPTLIFEGSGEFFSLMDHPPKQHSFPSGHATSFAAGGLIFAWLVKDWNRIFQVAIGLVTVLLCYTRVHIGVHFLGDILVGNIIGTLLGMLIFWASYRPISRWLEKRSTEKLDSLQVYIGFVIGLSIGLRYFYLIFLS